MSIDDSLNFPNIMVAPDEITDWIDLAPPPAPGTGAARKALYLFRMSDTDLVQIGTQFLIEIKSTLNPRTVGKMFLLAYNLRDHRDQNVFSDISTHLSSPETRIELDELSDSPMVVITGEPHANLRTDGLKINELSNAFCYLAASYLSLFTKTAENYSRVVSIQLKERYGKFFHTNLNFPLENYHPSIKALNFIKNIFRTTKDFSRTFYNLVHAGEQTEVGDGLKNYLYRVHISYTGLENLLLFVRCMDIYKVDYIDLLSVLYCRQFVAVTLSLNKAFENLYTEEAKSTKKMWKYARVFDRRFLSRLQTEHCRVFAAVLAYLVGKTAENAAQIRDLPELFKKRAPEIAEEAAGVLLSNRSSDGTFVRPSSSQTSPHPWMVDSADICFKSLESLGFGGVDWSDTWIGP